MQGKVNVNFRCDFLIDLLKSVCLHNLKFFDVIKTDKVKIKNSFSTLEEIIYACRLLLEVLTKHKCSIYSGPGR